MKKVTWLLWVVWLLAIFTAIVCMTAQLVAQDTVVITQGYVVHADSAQLRRLSYRADRQLDLNETIFKALRDHARATFMVERRLDSLREYVRFWTARQAVQKKGKKR